MSVHDFPQYPSTEHILFMRFSLRDLLWLTVVVGLALTLLVQDRRHDILIGLVRRHAMALRDELADAEHNEQVYLDKIANTRDLGEELIEIDWTLADRGIP